MACPARSAKFGISRHQKRRQELALADMPGVHGVSATPAVQRLSPPGPCLPDGEGCTKSFRSDVVPTLNVLRSFQITCRLNFSAPRLASTRPSQGRPGSTPPVPKSYTISMLQQRYALSAGVERWTGGRHQWPLLQQFIVVPDVISCEFPPQCPHAHEVGTSQTRSSQTF